MELVPGGKVHGDVVQASQKNIVDEVAGSRNCPVDIMNSSSAQE